MIQYLDFITKYLILSFLSSTLQDCHKSGGGLPASPPADITPPKVIPTSSASIEMAVLNKVFIYVTLNEAIDGVDCRGIRL